MVKLKCSKKKNNIVSINPEFSKNSLQILRWSKYVFGYKKTERTHGQQMSTIRNTKSSSQAEGRWGPWITQFFRKNTGNGIFE